MGLRYPVSGVTQWPPTFCLVATLKGESESLDVYIHVHSSMYTQMYTYIGMHIQIGMDI